MKTSEILTGLLLAALCAVVGFVGHPFFFCFALLIASKVAGMHWLYKTGRDGST